jgi:hypothetical protein
VLRSGNYVLENPVTIEQLEPFHARLELNGIARHHVPETCEAFLILDGFRTRSVS